MKSYTDDKFGFVFLYPDNWTREKEDNVISVYDAENGFGALQFSIYYVGNEVQIDLRVELEDFLQDYDSFKIEMIDGFAYSKFRDGEIAWQYWFFRRGNSLVLASYNCEINDRGKEDKIIKNILDSFVQNSIN
ncbi:hypothetical protein KIM67_18295 [Flagellimonas sp. 389]|uniref:hypothetical protein n=1 Tax=Flagellimonas sp. 389 TaxID=2835862 RepID=UPI001BD50877|nr:hypothetical protein [Flagellimonas sp. 389]MBS9464378.1 hypothetical protein [Flagellimonas sp. 389]